MKKPAIYGRGATNNDLPKRFNLLGRESDGDWLDAIEEIDGSPAPLRTTVTVERAKSILSRNTSPDLGFDRSVNPYRGCEHGCIYCFARPTHAYHDLSPGMDFESRLFVKPDAALLLDEALSKEGYWPAPIALGTNTDPYQPIEREWQVTRSVLTLLLERRHPFTITTKSNRVLRDLDIIASAAKLGLAAVAVSVTSLNPKVHRTLEPRAPAPRKRLEAIEILSAAEVPTLLSISPVVPHITDMEMEAIIEAGAKAGASGAFFIPVRLPYEVAPLFKAWLQEHYRDRAGKVMATIRDLRGGRENDPRFFSRLRGEGVWAQLYRSRFDKAVRANGMTRPNIRLRTDLFTPRQGLQLKLL